MSTNSKTPLGLLITLPLLLGACSAAPDVVATEGNVSAEGTASEGVSTSPAAADAPSGNWYLGHAMSQIPAISGGFDATLTPGEARSLCHFLPVDRDFVADAVSLSKAGLPGTVRLVATGATATAARLLPGAFDCASLSGALEDPFYVAGEDAGAADELPGTLLEADSAVLIQYDVANPGTEDATASVHVVLAERM